MNKKEYSPIEAYKHSLGFDFSLAGERIVEFGHIKTGSTLHPVYHIYAQFESGVVVGLLPFAKLKVFRLPQTIHYA